MTDNSQDVLAAIDEVHAAFGAPGDYGYDTPKGRALFRLYKLQAGEPLLCIPPALTPALSRVLGQMVFRTCPVAHLFRDTGADIPRKTEDEQAFVLHWLLTLVAKHGDGWGKVAAAEVDRRTAELQERQAARG